MKRVVSYIILVLCVVLIPLQGHAQVARNGDTFTLVPSKGSARMDSVATKYFWETPTIPKTMIYINRNNGRCYIGRRSKTTGRYRREYIDEATAKAIAKEMGIKYTYIKKSK